MTSSDVADAGNVEVEVLMSAGNDIDVVAVVVVVVGLVTTLVAFSQCGYKDKTRTTVLYDYVVINVQKS